MNITIRNLSDDIINKIRTLSKSRNQSLNNEILIILELGIKKEMNRFFSKRRNISKSLQIKIWKRLSKEYRFLKRILER